MLHFLAAAYAESSGPQMRAAVAAIMNPPPDQICQSA
jgi:hypothetical protein